LLSSFPEDSKNEWAIKRLTDAHIFAILQLFAAMSDKIKEVEDFY